MEEINQKRNIKILFFLLAASKFISALVILSFYFSSKNINYLPVALILILASLGIIYLYFKKVK